MSPRSLSDPFAEVPAAASVCGSVASSGPSSVSVSDFSDFGEPGSAMWEYNRRLVGFPVPDVGVPSVGAPEFDLRVCHDDLLSSIGVPPWEAKVSGADSVDSSDGSEIDHWSVHTSVKSPSSCSDRSGSGAGSVWSVRTSCADASGCSSPGSAVCGVGGGAVLNLPN